MLAGWQVFIPILDSGHATDLLISDGLSYYRIQIKTIEAQDESHMIANKWKGSKIDYVVVFAKKSNWGYICPAFQSSKKRMNHVDHKRFTQNRKSFLAAFHTI
jgi:N-acetylglutamate synthase/N-acetylornithine aminotransferase